MVGNVWELVDRADHAQRECGRLFPDPVCSPPPSADEPWYAIRGGAFNGPLFDAVIWDAGAVPARWKAPNIGFRCVKDAR